jgi:hypothetical protein
MEMQTTGTGWRWLIEVQSDKNPIRRAVRMLTRWAWQQHLEDRMSAAYSAGWSDRADVGQSNAGKERVDVLVSATGKVEIIKWQAKREDG